MKKTTPQFDGALSRRSFVKGALTAGLAAGSLTALGGCAPNAASEKEVEKPIEAGTGSNTDLSSLGQAQDIASFDFVDILDTEVLVVGAGNAGSNAFLSAVENGAKTILIEKGTDQSRSMAKNNLSGFDSSAAKAKGVALDKATVIHEITRYASGRCDQALIKLWADNSGETLDRIEELLKENGCHFVLETEETEGLYIKEFLTSHMGVNDNDGQTKVDHTGFAIQKAISEGGDYYTETALVQLIKENDRVTGIVAKNANGYVRINASKGVILCTGGYSTNLEMMKILNPLALSTAARIDPVNTDGAGILAGLWAGAIKDEVPTVMVFDRGALLPDENPGIEPYDRAWWWPGSQPFLRVNHNGERFVAESNPYDFIVHAASLQPRKSWIQVWDANFWKYVEQFQTVGCAKLIQKEGSEAPVIWSREVIEKDWANLEQGGQIVKADTLDELAEAFGMSVDTFKETVERYNGFAATGVDEDFYCEGFRISPLDTPPYYGINLASRLLCTLDGLRVNTKLQVLDQDCNCIEGLYAAGNDSGGFFCNNYPELIVALAAGRTVTFGRLAGKNAAQS